MVDVDQQKVSIVIDGVQEVSNLDYTDSGAGTPQALIFNRYSKDNPTGTAQFDNVVIQTS